MTWDVVGRPSRVNAAARSPRDPIVLAMIGRPAPERAVLPVKEDCVDRPGCPIIEVEPVAHRAQLASGPGRCVLPQRQATRLRLLLAAPSAHLVAGDVRRLDPLLP